MQVSLWLFGAEVFTFRVGPPPADEQPTGNGDCTTIPIGFTARFDRPDEADLPDRG